MVRSPASASASRIVSWSVGIWSRPGWPQQLGGQQLVLDLVGHLLPGESLHAHGADGRDLHRAIRPHCIRMPVVAVVVAAAGPVVQVEQVGQFPVPAEDGDPEPVARLERQVLGFLDLRGFARPEILQITDVRHGAAGGQKSRPGDQKGAESHVTRCHRERI